MNILINYADNRFFEAQKENSRTGLENGFDKVIEYGRKDIYIEYLNKHKDILNVSTGAGYWLWKPYIIHKTLLTMSTSDILFYCDSGASFVGDMSEYFKKCKENKNGLILFSGGHFINKTYTCPACFDKMDGWEYKDRDHLQASFQLCRKTDFTLNFYKKTLEYCEIKEAIETGDFVDHRWDQSILSIMALRYNITVLKDLSQGEKNVIIHHRNRK